MDSNLTPSPSDNHGEKAEFRKPSNDAVSRKYRRRSPVDWSSSPDGSPNRAHGTSPPPATEDPAKSFDDRRRKDDKRDLDTDHGRSQYGRRGDSHRDSDRHSSRSSHNYRRHDDYKREKIVDEDERRYPKLTSRSSTESRAAIHSDHRSRDRDREVLPIGYKKYKDRDSLSDRAGSGRRQSNLNSEEVRSGERERHRGTGNDRDDRRDYRKSAGDHKKDLSPRHEESRGNRHDSTSRRDSSGHRLKETSKCDSKDPDYQKYPKEEKKERDDYTSEDQISLAKKPKFGLEKVSKFTSTADERQPPDLQQAEDCVGEITTEQNFVKDTDIDAAKVAAMKAAELVNKNLIGAGYMSADQKKKLLWGNKKNTTVEESTHRWDTSLFSDRDRQEKFNKLMSLRLPWCIWPIVGCEGRDKSGKKTRQSRWREAESTPAGFGEAIYCWTASKRWPYSWTRSLRIYLEIFCTLTNLGDILLYNCARNMFLLTGNEVCCWNIEYMMKSLLPLKLGLSPRAVTQL